MPLGASPDFESYDNTVLCGHLRSFFANARKKDGSCYKKTSLDCIKYGLARYIKDKKKIDINADPDFLPARETYSAVIVKLKCEDFADVKHYPAITAADLKKPYDHNHQCLDIDTPVGLQNKVFEIMYYICR